MGFRMKSKFILESKFRKGSWTEVIMPKDFPGMFQVVMTPRKVRKRTCKIKKKKLTGRSFLRELFAWCDA